eukprot:3710019-Amphidinium_carterae.1
MKKPANNVMKKPAFLIPPKKGTARLIRRPASTKKPAGLVKKKPAVLYTKSRSMPYVRRGRIQSSILVDEMTEGRAFLRKLHSMGLVNVKPKCQWCGTNMHP